jgi:hypothetical protein
MNKTRSNLHMLKKIKLTHRCIKCSPFICNQPYRSLFFDPVRFASVQLTSSSPFPLPGVIFAMVNVVTPSHCIMLPSYWAKTMSLPPLHLPITLCLIASSLESKLKHWIRTTAAGYPSRTAQLSPSTIIKKHYFNVGHSPTTQLRLHFTSHLTRAPRHWNSTTVIVPFHHYLTSIIHPYNNIHDDKLTHFLWLPQQLITCNKIF